MRNPAIADEIGSPVRISSHLRGGLLLRCDLHALFDRWLITIDPDTWSIRIAPELKRYPGLAKLDGRTVQLPEDLRPRLKYIQEHATLAHASWK